MDENNRSKDKDIRNTKDNIIDDVVVVDDIDNFVSKDNDSSDKDNSSYNDNKKEDKTREDVSKEGKSKEDKSQEGKSKEDKLEEGKSKEEKSEEDKPEKEKSEEDKSQEDKSKEDKSKEGKSEKDKSGEDNKKNTTSENTIDFDEPKIIDAPKKKDGKKGLLIALGTVAGLLLIAYVAGFVYFSSHFYKDVTVNGINVSNMNKDSAKNTLDTFYKDYQLTLLTIDDEEVVIDGKDISAKVNLHDEFSKCFEKQEPALWFVNMFSHHDFDISADATWDETKLDEYLDGLDILQKKNMIKPEDAYVGVVDSKFEIIKEVMGSTVNEKVFDDVLKDSLSTVQSKLDMVEAGCYELPKVYSDDEELNKDLEAKNEYSGNVIVIQMDDLKLEPGMELYEEVLEKSGDKYIVSKTKVAKYVNDLANRYDSVGKERTFTTSFGSRKIKTTGTVFGYELDKDATADALYKALTAGKSSSVEAVFISKGKSLVGDNDIGDTYVEVNLSEQKVIGYKNGKKVAEGDCVSGNESAGHGTSTGLYSIQEKLSPTVLRGEKKAVTKTTTKKNKKGKKVKKTTTSYEYEYESPVTYWLQFNGGQGLHDAAGWRSSYGGSIYYYSGSHGCVNLPLDLAKTIYENFEVGDPVIVYFWDNENRK